MIGISSRFCAARSRDVNKVADTEGRCRPEYSFRILTEECPLPFEGNNPPQAFPEDRVFLWHADFVRSDDIVEPVGEGGPLHFQIESLVVGVRNQVYAFSRRS